MTADGGFADLPADRRRRARMVRDQLADCPDPRVLAAMAALPRHCFLPDGLRAGAYDDHARGIGAGQTISQPRIVARMLAALRVQAGERILDVGAGSGYAAALLARLAAPGQVIAIERQGLLIPETAERLRHFAPGVILQHGDGLDADVGTFDVIHLAATCTERPRRLLDRLRPGGRLIAPVVDGAGCQRLLLVANGMDRWFDEVDFVPALPGTAG